MNETRKYVRRSFNGKETELTMKMFYETVEAFGKDGKYSVKFQKNCIKHIIQLIN